MFNSARDTLNPQLNSELVKNRLWVIDHYKFRYGRDHTYWVNAALRNIFTHVNRFKFNYALKTFFAYQMYLKWSQLRYYEDTMFLTNTQRA